VRFLLALLFTPFLPGAQFVEHTVADDLKGGYQVVAADVNRDGKLDLLAVASGQTDLVWFENPRWQRHLIARNLKGMINLAYWNDQIVLASGFSSDPRKSTGLVSLLVPDGDPRAPWRIKEIDRLTTSHRLRWADIDGTGNKVLVNAPLAGAKAEPPDYRDHVPLVFYRPPEWKRQLISDANTGVQHGLLIFDWNGDGRDEILTASFSGIDLFQRPKNGEWRRTEVAKGDPAPCPKCGASDIAVGHLKNERFLAAIEPWHGNELAVYHREDRQWQRRVIDSSLAAGHTIAAADLDNDGLDEIIAGYRGNGGSVLLYRADASGNWSKSVMDPHISANACLVADLNNDGRLDIACIGGAVLKWYENR
jgi:hypothetical protein